MTAAVLISMIFSFWMGQSGEMLPTDPAKSAERFIEKLDGLKIETKQGCPMSFHEFVAVRAELKKADPHAVHYFNS